jgi:uncharacterized membrane protein YhaH (DUF805 family)
MDLMLLAAAFQDAEEYPRGGGILGALFGGVFMIVWLVVLVAVIAGMWKMFEKAGKPGWAAIVPIYNIIVMLEIVGRPLWWIVLFLIPCVSIVAWIMIAIDLAKAFGKDVAYGIGIALLGFIFIPMLGFGDARYVGPPARV